jgi:hypothetical protein
MHSRDRVAAVTAVLAFWVGTRPAQAQALCVPSEKFGVGGV